MVAFNTLSILSESKVDNPVVQYTSINNNYYTEGCKLTIDIDKFVTESKTDMYRNITTRNYENNVEDYMNETTISIRKKSFDKLKSYINESYNNYSANMTKLKDRLIIESSNISKQDIKLPNIENSLLINPAGRLKESYDIYCSAMISEADSKEVISVYPKAIKNSIISILNKIEANNDGTILGKSISESSIYEICDNITCLYSSLLEQTEHVFESIYDSYSKNEYLEEDFKRAFKLSKLDHSKGTYTNSKIVSNIATKFANKPEKELAYLNKAVGDLEASTKDLEKTLKEYKALPADKKKHDAAKVNVALTALGAVSSMYALNIAMFQVDEDSIVENGTTSLKSAKSTLKLLTKRRNSLEAELKGKKLKSNIDKKRRGE